MATNKNIYNELIQEILLITTVMQKDFPARYEHLDETPLFLSGYDHIELPELQQYLETISLQLPPVVHL